MIKLHNSHPERYVPLWKQWMETKEYKKYIKDELPLIEQRMTEMTGLTQQQRNDIMVKQFHLRWIDSKEGKAQETTHTSEKSAKDRARELSMDNAPVQLGEVEDGKLIQQWNFEKGRQQEMNTKKQVTVAPISKKEAAQIPSSDKPKKADKSVKSGQKKATKEPPKATSGAQKAKTQPLPTAAKPEPVKTGTVRDQFGLREGSNRAKLVDALLAAKGKPVAVSALIKAVYGQGGEVGALNMVIKGMNDMIIKNKIKMEIVKTKDDKGGTIALKSK